MGHVDRQEVRGDVAQLVERPLCTRKASGSNPLISTSFKGFSKKKVIKCVFTYRTGNIKILVIFEMFVSQICLK